jgi:hypothetical protein
LLKSSRQTGRACGDERTSAHAAVGGGQSSRRSSKRGISASKRGTPWRMSSPAISTRAASCRSPSRATSARSPLYYNHISRPAAPSIGQGPLHDPATSTFRTRRSIPFGYGSVVHHVPLTVIFVFLHLPFVRMGHSPSLWMWRIPARERATRLCNYTFGMMLRPVTRPEKELKGFRKISLNAGEKKSVQFTVTPEELSFYNLSMKKIVEPGTFTVYVGGNSVDCIEGSFKVAIEHGSDGKNGFARMSYVGPSDARTRIYNFSPQRR